MGKITYSLARYLPILTWGAKYSRQTLASDLVAPAIVTVMAIFQDLSSAFSKNTRVKGGL